MPRAGRIELERAAALAVGSDAELPPLALAALEREGLPVVAVQPGVPLPAKNCSMTLAPQLLSPDGHNKPKLPGAGLLLPYRMRI